MPITPNYALLSDNDLGIYLDRAEKTYSSLLRNRNATDDPARLDRIQSRIDAWAEIIKSITHEQDARRQAKGRINRSGASDTLVRRILYVTDGVEGTVTSYSDKPTPQLDKFTRNSTDVYYLVDAEIEALKEELKDYPGIVYAIRQVDRPGIGLEVTLKVLLKAYVEAIPKPQRAVIGFDISNLVTNAFD